MYAPKLSPLEDNFAKDNLENLLFRRFPISISSVFSKRGSQGSSEDNCVAVTYKQGLF